MTKSRHKLRKFTAAESGYIRAQWRRQSLRSIAEELNRRSPDARLKIRTASVYNHAVNVLGLDKLTDRPAKHPKAFEEFIAKKHAQGMTDGQIETAWNKTHQPKFTRRAVTTARNRLGLAVNYDPQSAAWKRRVSKKTKAQCRQAGAKSLAEIRSRAHRSFAEREGWPADLPPRAVQMLNAIYDHGPQTRHNLAAMIGMPWKGSRKSLVGSVESGSYLGLLQRRGLVTRLRKAIRDPIDNTLVDLYSIPLHIRRNRPHEQKTRTQSDSQHRQPDRRTAERPAQAAAGCL